MCEECLPFWTPQSQLPTPQLPNLRSVVSGYFFVVDVIICGYSVILFSVFHFFQCIFFGSQIYVHNFLWTKGNLFSEGVSQDFSVYLIICPNCLVPVFFVRPNGEGSEKDAIDDSWEVRWHQIWSLNMPKPFQAMFDSECITSAILRISTTLVRVVNNKKKTNKNLLFWNCWNYWKATIHFYNVTWFVCKYLLLLCLICVTPFIL